MGRLWPGLPPHIIGIFQQLGQAQYPHRRRKVLGGNLVKGNLHLVPEFMEHPFLYGKAIRRVKLVL